MRAADPRTRIANRLLSVRKESGGKKPERTPRTRPGDRWSVLAWYRDGARVEFANQGEFDELCVGAPCWLHAEQMGTRCWWIRIGDHDMWIRIDKKGEPHLMHELLGDLDLRVAEQKKKDDYK